MNLVSVISNLLGGIGLFLIGMKLMSDGLKAVAGSSLHTVLERYTQSRFSAFLSGAGLTALVQSSSATTVATIGFVSAGLLTLPASLGVIIGANVGTTSTGWIVSMLGFKLSVGALALPLIGIGALLNLVGKGRKAHFGMSMTGFGLIFIGIDFLQNGMAGLETRIDLSVFEATTIGDQLLLVLVGIAMTAIVQSSSVAVALTLTALASGTIGLTHAAFLVVGQNLGTTVTAMLASLGASVPARRAAVGHIVFNVATGALAFVFAGPLIDLVIWLTAESDDMAMRIALFHTLFNVAGALIALPLLSALVWLVVRLVPDRVPSITRNLDKSLLEMPAVAMEATHRALVSGLSKAMQFASLVLRESEMDEDDREALYSLRADVREVMRFLTSIHIQADGDEWVARRLSLVHAGDHLERLIRAVLEPPSRLYAATEMASILSDAHSKLISSGAVGESAVSSLHEASSRHAEKRRTSREKTLQRTALGDVSADSAHESLMFEAWIDRLAYHSWRCAHHLSHPSGNDTLK